MRVHTSYERGDLFSDSVGREGYDSRTASSCKRRGTALYSGPEVTWTGGLIFILDNMRMVCFLNHVVVREVKCKSILRSVNSVDEGTYSSKSVGNRVHF